LIRRIAWRLQANEEGGLSRAALKKAEELAVDADTRVTAPRKHSNDGVKLVVPEPTAFVDWDPRLPPPGNIVERQHKGKMIRVIVLQDGFEYEGRRYKSLTAIAKEVSGWHCNGFLFFRLGRKARVTNPHHAPKQSASRSTHESRLKKDLTAKYRIASLTFRSESRRLSLNSPK
jgi:hypothetical protein